MPETLPSEDPNDYRPKDLKKRPAAGQLIYVPDRSGLAMLHGGLARVSESSTKRTVYVDEDPGSQYTWWDLQFKQLELWAKFGVQRARMATHEEIQQAKADDEEKRELAKRAVEEKLQAEWAPKKYPVLNRGLMAVPIVCEHRRGKNWAAVVEVDPTLPGGLKRKWFNRGNGPVFYIVPDNLEVGDAVEFGADYVQGSGKREGNRWYGVVLAVELTHLTLQRCADEVDVAMRSSVMKTTGSLDRGPVQPQASEPVSS